MRNYQLFFCSIIALILMPIHLCEAQNSLTVKFSDGSENVTLLSTLNKITFSEGNLLLNKKEIGTNSYQISNISKLTFGLFSEIPAVSTDHTSIIIFPNPAKDFIRLKNIPPGKYPINIYGLNGNLLYTCSLSEASQQIDLSNLDKGFYILKVNGQNLKFVKQ